jgi:hypothetical protein
MSIAFPFLTLADPPGTSEGRLTREPQLKSARSIPLIICKRWTQVTVDS